MKKLGIAAGMRVSAPGAPAHYRALIDPLPAGVRFSSTPDATVDLVHAFVTTRAVLARTLTTCRKTLAAAAVVWVSWPKKSAKMKTDDSEDTIREVALPLGFVDIKVCAVDDTWSGLKLVLRRELR